ncbi:hypothetical protein [Flavobacterium sp. SM2513]|uniref:hypothetical protein n=1 Tax=Flavobacterium sp. SM2513 TaxID=3424766 RepID=UPI003D7F9AD3
MRIFSVVFLLISNFLFAQPLTLTIESITSKDSLPNQREFKLKYFIKNNTSDTLHFFFLPKNISPSTGGSLTKEIYYKIYENDNFIEIGLAFNQVTLEKSEFDFEGATQTQKDSLIIVYFAKKVEEDVDKLLKIFKEKGTAGLLDSSNDYIQKIYKKRDNYYHTLLPNQREDFEAVFQWNKDRYYYNEPNEFYLDDNAKHYFEITLVALKEEFKDKLDAELYNKIMKEPNFIKGVFVSDKVEINFNSK